MLRLALFAVLMLGGTALFQGFGLLGRDEAWLLSAVVAAIIVFCIPKPEQRRRDPADLMVTLILVVVGYGILFKFRTWLSTLIDGRLAAAVSISLILIVAGALLMAMSVSRGKSRTDNG